MLFLRPALLVVALALLVSPARAASDAATASQLEQDLKTLAILMTKEVSLLKLEGDPKVVADGEGYAVTLPGLRVNLDAGDYARVPALLARLEPQADGTYKFAITLPTPLLSLYDITDIPTHVAALQAQDVSGIWDIKNQLVRSIKLDLRGLTLTEQAKNFIAISLDRLRLSGENVLSPDGKMDGNSLFTLSALRGYDEKDNEVFNLAGAAISYKVQGADWSRVLQARNAATANLRGNTIDATALANLAGRVGGLGGKSAVAVVLRDVGGRFVAESMGSTEVTATQLSELRMLFSSTQDSSGQFTGDMHYHHDGLQVTGLPSPVLSLMIPASASLIGRVENIPLEAVLSGLESAGVPQVATEPGAAGTQANTTQLLDKAKARLVLEKLDLNAPLLTMTSQGSFNASAPARFGFIGNLNNRIGKIDALAARLGKEAARPMTPDQLPDPMAPSLLMALNMLRGFGNVVPGGTDLREYMIEVNNAGSVSLNGTDVMSLILGSAAMSSGYTRDNTPPPAPQP
jgi:hypothetical protein